MWKPLDDKKVECQVCSHRCKIPDKATGICNARKNKGGKMYALNYGKVSSMGPDPIEKKPLYHFMPSTRAFSLGSVGCNFRCDYCQNYGISQQYEFRHLKTVHVDEIPGLAKKYHCQSISWTYNEPAIWFEYTLDGSKVAHKAGLATSYVTNGFITEEALREIAPYLDAMNIDVKSFRDDFYRKYSKSRLQPVLDTCVLAKELGIFIELVYLMIPTRNDDPNEIKEYCDWVVNNLGDDTPIHFSAFHPDYKVLDLPRTPIKILEMAHKTAKEQGLKFVYLGNIPHRDEENTYCPKCGELAIQRFGYHVLKTKIKDGNCGACGQDLNIIENPEF